MGATDILGAGATGASAGSILGPAGALAGGAIGLGAGIIGYFVDSGAEDTARSIEQAAQKKYGEVTDATLAKAAADVLGPTAFSKITQDPAFARAQKDALASLQAEANQHGMTQGDRARANDFFSQSALASRRAREGSLQQMSRGGLFGSGAEAQLAIQSGQDAANRNSQQAQNMYGDAEARALDAMSRAGTLGGQLQQQDWQRQSDVARAQDERERALWGNRQQVYRDQMGQAATQYGFAEQNANATRGAGQRQGDAIAGQGRAVGSLLNSTGANVAAGAPRGGAAPAAGGSTGDEFLASNGLKAPDPEDPYWKSGGEGF